MRSGVKSLTEGLRFLEALHNQLLNVSKPESQQLELFGVMCPRWAASDELTDAEAKTLMVDVIRRRAIQSAPVLYTIKVLRELIKEHGLAELIPESALHEGYHWTEAGDPCNRKDCSCAARRRIEAEKAAERASWPVCAKCTALAGSQVEAIRHKEGRCPSRAGS